jgi:hypothetical protein
MLVTLTAQHLNTLQNGFIRLTISRACCEQRRGNFYPEDVHKKSLEFMIKKKIILSESADQIGLLDEYYCVSKSVEGNVKSGINRNYQRIDVDKKYFYVLNTKMYHLKILLH